MSALLWIALLWPVQPDPTSQTGPTLETAVDAYQTGRYEQAAEAFEALAREEGDARRRAVLVANAGTAAARADRLGEAMWLLETACRLAPRDEVAARNLEQLRARLGKGASEASQFTTAVLRLPLRLTPSETGQAVGALVALGLVLLAARRARGLPIRAGRWGLAVLVVALAWQQVAAAAREADLRRTVVIVDALAMRAEPNEQGEVLYRLEAGAVVRDEEQRRGWRLVQTPDGARGWVSDEGVRSAGS